MKDQIPQFLENEFTKGKSFTNKFPEEIKQFMIDYSNNYSWDLGSNLKRILRVMKQGVTDLPICKLDGCNKKTVIKVSSTTVTEACCSAHARKVYYMENYGVENVSQLKETKEKKIATTMKNYGVSNPSQADVIKKKKEETMMKNFGVRHNFCNGELRDKAFEKGKAASLEKYGVEFYQQSEQGKKNYKAILMERYGVEALGAIPGNEEKKRKTCMARYGVENVFQDAAVNAKRSEVMIARYGTDIAMHSAEILSKLMNNVFRRKEFQWNTGEISILQGYEPTVLKELEDAGYKFKDVITDVELMPDFYYCFEGKLKRYYPDFYIPDEKLIIEVKSLWTLEQGIDMNKAKFKVVIDDGFNFKLEIRSAKGEKIKSPLFPLL